MTGNVSVRQSPRNAHDAKNFPTIACQMVTGLVSNSSMVPTRRSSAQSRIPTHGTKKRYSHERHMKKESRFAWPRSKKLPVVNVRNPVNKRNMTINTYATGDE